MSFFQAKSVHVWVVSKYRSKKREPHKISISGNAEKRGQSLSNKFQMSFLYLSKSTNILVELYGNIIFLTTTMTLQENRKNYASCSFLAGFSPWKFPRGHFNCWTPNFQRRLNHPFKSLVNWAENLQKSPTTQTSGKTDRRKKTCVMCNMWTKIDFFFFIYCMHAAADLTSHSQ